MLEDRDVEAPLVAEVVIDHPRVGAGPLADPLDAGAAVTVGGELADRRAQDLLSGPVRIPLGAVHRAKSTSQTEAWRNRCFQPGGCVVNTYLLMQPSLLRSPASQPRSSRAVAPTAE